MHPWDLIWGRELRDFDMLLKQGKAKGQAQDCAP